MRSVRAVDELARTLGIHFKDSSLLRLALVHRSFQNEFPAASDGTNERLEFLGDSVLGMIVTETLYQDHPSRSEGELTGMRSALVRTETLARLSRRLGLGQWVALGRGEESGGGRERLQILAGTFEAVVGAVYLDSGLDSARAFVLEQLAEDLAALESAGPSKDDKSALQELTQARWQLTPVYVTVGSIGPEHKKEFVVEVVVGGRKAGGGQGRTKQIAEQTAARNAIEVFQAGVAPESLPPATDLSSTDEESLLTGADDR